MSSTIEQALTGLVHVFTMAKRPAPFQGSTSGYSPRLEGLFRDEHYIVMQLAADATIEHPKAETADGGDSAHRTGVLAFCNSAIDAANLPAFEVVSGVMTRHPSQAPWNDPNNCSRDQLIAYIAGCWRAGRTDIVVRLLDAHARRDPPFTCQNIQDKTPDTLKQVGSGDLLAPHEIMYFRICAGDNRAQFDLAAQLSLYVAIMTSPADKDVEPNQILLLSIVCGQLDLYLEQHQGYRDALHEYWSGWRKQACIAQSMNDVINLEIGRYSPVPLLDILIPKHLLEEIRHLNLGAEMKKFLSENPLQLADLSVRFIVASMQDIQEKVEMLVRSMATLKDFEREITRTAIVALRKVAADALTTFEENVARLDPTGITSTVMSIAASILGLGSSSDAVEERQFREQTRQALQKITDNTEKTLQAVTGLQSKMVELFAQQAAFIKQELHQLVATELSSELMNAAILLRLRNDSPLSPALQERLTTQASILRGLIYRVAEFGEGTLGYCFQAYGVLIAILDACGDATQEILATRDAFAQTRFKSMLEAPKGPIAQSRDLQGIREAEAREFLALQRESVIGVLSFEQTKEWYDPKNRNEPLIVGTGTWDITLQLATISGDIEQPALIKQRIELRHFDELDDSVQSAEALKAFAPALTPADDVVFVIGRAGRPQVGSQEDIDAKASARLARAHLASQRFIDAARLQPDLDALALAVKTTFNI